LDISYGTLACIVLSVYFAQFVPVPTDASSAQLEGIPRALRRPLAPYPTTYYPQLLQGIIGMFILLDWHMYHQLSLLYRLQKPLYVLGAFNWHIYLQTRRREGVPLASLAPPPPNPLVPLSP
jgi:hypothetical protein